MSEERSEPPERAEPELDREDWHSLLETRLAAHPWRSYADLIDAPELRAELAAEFPLGCDLPPTEASRRSFLKLLGASVALAGLTGCTRAPSERIVPYASQPPEVTPGRPTHYATTFVVDGYGTGLLVESHEGRPTKVEGNPHHPASLGASSAVQQASVLSLYDPSRARGIRQRGNAASFESFVKAFGPRAAERPFTRSGGEGLHLLMEPTSSPTTISLLQRVRARYPSCAVHFHAALARNAAWEGTRLAFGRPLDVDVDLTRADVVLALDADLFQEGPAALRRARDFADRRRVRSTADSMSRLYVVESTPTVTGGMADHRLRARRSDIAGIALELLTQLGKLRELPGAALLPERKSECSSAQLAWIAALARDLQAHAGRAAVVVGEGQPALVHAIAHLIDSALGNVGHAVTFAEPVIFEAGTPSHDVAELGSALAAGRVDTLFILGGNPVYTTPRVLALEDKLARASERVYLGLYENETARGCTWVMPQAHYLEAWGDALAYDGSASIAQPLIEPLFAGRTIDELLAVLTGDPAPRAHELVQQTWRARASGEFEPFWQQALHAGVVAGSALARVDVRADWQRIGGAIAELPAKPAGLELSFPADTRVRDGAFSNNAWLLELPDPITKLTWENALLVSPRTAAKYGLSTEDLVELELHGRRVDAPVFVQPGQADDSVSLALGYGRRGAEALASGLGVNAYALRTVRAPAFECGATLTRRAGKHELASTQAHWSMEGRDLVRRATRLEYEQTPQFAKRHDEPRASLYKVPLLGAQQWAMSIDLNACNGCSACVIACQAENNTPIVGKTGVRMHREMHWIRLDRYFDGSIEDPTVSVQPMLCQHCEKAPCEYVCPVNATVHSPDGLNEQVYNRCVGTRFCSNNCAWKVRRFNWFNYQEFAARAADDAGERGRALHAMVMNPDVTVRARGVMEKCTYCVQRIREKEIGAKIARAPIADGEVVPACAQACPTRAITFGSLTTPGSEVKRLRANDRDYAVLGELGSEPRTRYLARLTNPNPELTQ